MIANLRASDPNRTGLGFTNTAGVDRQVISEYLADPDATMSEAMWELEQIGIRISYDGEIEASGSSRPNQPQQLGLERVERVRARQPGLLPQCAPFQLRRRLLSHGHRHSRPAHGEPHQAVGGGHAKRATHVVERPSAQRASRPRLRPRPHHARRTLPRRGLLARAAHSHERPVALRLRREEDRPAGQRQVDLAEPQLHPLPQRLRLRAVRLRGQGPNDSRPHNNGSGSGPKSHGSSTPASSDQRAESSHA